MPTVFINGAFGIGKSSAAKALRARVPGSKIVDPEVIGFFVRRLGRIFPLEGRGTGDYQDMPLWRRWTTKKIARAKAPLVIVPMAFSNLAYLNEIRDGVAGHDVRHVCLVAPLSVIEHRLRARNPSPAVLQWQLRRAAECSDAHKQPAFAVQIDTEGKSPDAIAAVIQRLLG